MSDTQIYLDNAATTRTDPEVVKAMLPYFDEKYAVASSQFSHSPGLEAREGLDHAREIIAASVQANPEEIIFTSGGTESNNLAIKGMADAFAGKKKHLICSGVEHNTVLHSCQWLESHGFELTVLSTDNEGFTDPDELRNAITADTFLVSIQHGNQEVGTIQDIQTLGQICKEREVLFHTDASLSYTHLDLNVKEVNVDLITLSAHKIHGPRGVGALYIREGSPLKKIFHGGYSEFDFRPGTENVVGAVGFGRAVEVAGPEQNEHVRTLQKHLIHRLTNEIEDVLLNGPADLDKRLPGNVNVSFDLIEGESVVLHLDMRGISVITGSACFSRSLEPSYVMMAMGYTHERAHGSIRYTLSRYNTIEEMDAVVDSCKEVVDQLRQISPLKK